MTDAVARETAAEREPAGAEAAVDPAAPAVGPRPGAGAASMPASGRGSGAGGEAGAGGDSLVAAVWAALAGVPDPEIPPVSIVDLGMVEAVQADAATGTVRVVLLPTFVGCPALGLIRRAVADRVRAVPGVARVQVQVVYSPPWSTDRITSEGRRKLAEFGIAPPRRGPVARGSCGSLGQATPAGLTPASPQPADPGGGAVPLAGGSPGPAAQAEPVPCPFCGSRDTRLENPFGPTPCRSIWYCRACRNPFERMKAL